MFEYYTYEHSPSRYKHIFTQVKELVESLSEDSEYPILESIVNEFKGNVMQKARAEFHNFREEDFRLLCYWYAEFSTSTISLLMKEENTNALYNRKSRLKKKIENSDSAIKSFFIGLLP